MTIALNGNDLTFEQLYGVALRGEKVTLTFKKATNQGRSGTMVTWPGTRVTIE